MDMADYLTGDRPIRDMAKVISILYESWNKSIFIIGNGGSASTASHFACDLSKLGFAAYSLTDNGAIVTATTNDDGFDSLFLEQLGSRLCRLDVLVAISVHGGVGEDKAGAWSQNLMKALDYARDRGSPTIGLVGFEGGLIRKFADASIKIPAYSTPQVESWHSHICHLIVEILREFQPVKTCVKCSRVYEVGKHRCPACDEVMFSLIGGVRGNIEEIRKLIDISKVAS